MNESCLYGHQGIVEEIQLPGKAVLSFNSNDESHRVLLWIKNYLHKGKNLEQTDSFDGKLNIYDTIYFDCHTYNQEDSKDDCNWYAVKAWTETNTELDSTKLINQTAYVYELDHGKGVLQFVLNDEEQHVFFMRSKFYWFGKRPGNKRTLSEFLNEDDPVQFDADMCEPAPDNKNCQWFASLVWKGKKPTGASNQVASQTGTNDENLSANDWTAMEDCDTQQNLPPGISQTNDYKSFELNNLQREGHATVAAFINEDCGVAFWKIRENCLESIFFHRKNLYLDDHSISSDHNLEDVLPLESMLEISAVQAVEEFPCKWIALIAISYS